MRTYPRPSCYLCGKEGQVVYDGLKDRLYNVPGVWAIRQCVNKNCGLLWLDPTPIEEDIAEAYSDYFTHSVGFNSSGFQLRQRIKRGLVGLKYGYKPQTALLERALAIPLLFFPFLSEQIIATSCGYLHSRNLGKALEIGFGNGALLNNLHMLGWEVEGIDFDATAVESAYHNFNINVKEGSLKEQMYAEDYFDAIVMSHVIEHVHDPLSLLSECRRIIKPSGQIVITTPNVESLGQRDFGAAWVHLDPPRHLNLFSIKTLSTLAESCGLAIINVRTTAKNADTVWIMSNAIKQEDKWIANNGKSVVHKVAGKNFQIKENLFLLFRPHAGEEIILVATKEKRI